MYWLYRQLYTSAQSTFIPLICRGSFVSVCWHCPIRWNANTKPPVYSSCWSCELVWLCLANLNYVFLKFAKRCFLARKPLITTLTRVSRVIQRAAKWKTNYWSKSCFLFKMLFLKMVQKENDYSVLCLLTRDIPHCTPPLTMSQENYLKHVLKIKQ